MKKILLLCATFILLFSINGCAASKPLTGIVLNMSSSVGAVDGNSQQQKLTYFITLSSYEDHDIYITAVTPVFTAVDNTQIINESTSITVNKTLLAHSYLNINGELIINPAGLSKAEIAATNKLTGVKISSSEIISLPQ